MAVTLAPLTPSVAPLAGPAAPFTEQDGPLTGLRVQRARVGFMTDRPYQPGDRP